jgi:cation:H+ antiporter
MDFAYILIGLAGLYFGGEGLVRGSVALAERMGVSQLIIGLTIVGMGTSAPELLVSLQAALSGKPDIALGNVVGSNIANILLILGVSAMVYPIAHWDRAVRRDALVAVTAAASLYFLVQFDVIGRFSGMALIAGLAAYLWMVYSAEKKSAAAKAKADLPGPLERRDVQPTWVSAAFILGGLVLLVAGADFLVTGAVNIARNFGVPESVIGLTIVAVGTSLPELATSVTAALKRHSDVALGNVVGSNIFNILGILGVTALVNPVGVDQGIAHFDTPLMGLVTLGLLAVLYLRHSITKQMGGLMVAGYAAYTIWLFV